MTEYEDRWLTLVQHAESPQALDWVVGQIERKQAMTERVATAIAERRGQIEKEAPGWLVTTPKQ